MTTVKLCAFSDESDGSFVGQIAALKRNGIPYMEMRSVDGKNVSELTVEQAKVYRAQLEAEGLAVWAVGSPLGKVDVLEDFETYKKTVGHVCEVARALGTDKIRMFSFYNAYNAREEVLKRLAAMVEIAKNYGVELYHENEKDIYGDTLARVQDILENVKGIKSVYDPANFLQVGEKADDTIAALYEKTDYFHIKDVIVETGELVPAGYGDGKIATLVEKLHGEKVLSVEPHLAIFDAYKNIDNTEMKHKFHFQSNAEAFDAAVAALKKLLVQTGYKEEKGVFVK